MRRIGIVLPPGFRFSGLEILRDLAAMAEAYAADLYGETEPVQTISLQTLSLSGGSVVAADGRRVRVDGVLADAVLDGLYVADFEIDPAIWPAWLDAQDEALAVLGAVARRTGAVACAGAGVVLALEAGLGRSGPVAAAPFLVEAIRRGRRTAIDPTRTVVEATDFLSTAGLAGEPQLALRLIERAVTPHLAGVLARRIGAALPIEDTPDDAFAVTVLRPDDIVARARALIRAGFSHPMNLEAFALGLGVTPRTLARRFQSSIGMSPKAYQQHLRLASAQSMLVRTSRPVARIAAMVGYADTAFFCDLFKRRVGETPKAFRDRARRVSHPR